MNTRVLIAIGAAITAYELMIKNPNQTHWIALGLFAAIIIVSIEKKNTSYSHLATVLVSHVALIGTLLFTQTPIVEHLLALVATILTGALMSSALRERVTEAQGRKETTMQRTIQAILLGVLLLWYNVSIKVAEEFGVILLIPILLNFGATTIISFHIQKTFATAFDKPIATANALLTGFIVAQVTWVVMIWPFSFLTKSITVTAVLYILWNVIEQILKKNVRKKTLLTPTLLGIASIIAAILIGPWNS